jgi:hypothetical protein
MQERNPRVRQQRGNDPTMAGNVGHFGVAGQFQASRPREIRRVAQASDEIFLRKCFGVGGERQAVNDEATFAKRSHQPLFPLGRLPVPIFENLGHRPAGNGPDELPFLGQVPAVVHHVQRTVDHRCPVTLDHPGCHVGVADIEVSLKDQDDLLQRRRRVLLRTLVRLCPRRTAGADKREDNPSSNSHSCAGESHETFLPIRGHTKRVA